MTLKQVHINARDRRDLNLIQRIHFANPTYKAEQLVDGLRRENGSREPSDFIIRAAEIMVDPHQEARAIAMFKMGRIRVGDSVPQVVLKVVVIKLLKWITNENLPTDTFVRAKNAVHAAVADTSHLGLVCAETIAQGIEAANEKNLVSLCTQFQHFTKTTSIISRNDTKTPRALASQLKLRARQQRVLARVFTNLRSWELSSGSYLELLPLRMGAKASKPAQAASRKFPTRAPGNAVPQRAPGGAARQAEPKGIKDEAIRADGRDPDLDLDASTDAAYSERLRKMGVATPFPTLSNSSTAGPFSSPSSSSSSTYTETSSSLSPPKARSSNTTSTTAFYPPPSRNRTLNALEARRDLQARAEAEFEDPSRGREFLDAGLLRKALLLLNSGVEARDIEAKLKLKSGVVARLGPRGIAVPVGGAAKQTWGGLHE
ncbi:hypothetical protein FHL15_002797 [Xylaria flabelliformis]|uniref:Helix-turn-helix domain-containing protein n=1 Tax=Xylaria flabelliformis TaxID=2512241 RepID=A0A553I8J5_9PEZI|nr:hypothetical protein FHL15_002797 [Xylaria flabelliformis]